MSGGPYEGSASSTAACSRQRVTIVRAPLNVATTRARDTTPPRALSSGPRQASAILATPGFGYEREGWPNCLVYRAFGGGSRLFPLDEFHDEVANVLTVKIGTLANRRIKRTESGRAPDPPWTALHVNTLQADSLASRQVAVLR